jgi:hypothetical protein
MLTTIQFIVRQKKGSVSPCPNHLELQEKALNLILTPLGDQTI